VGCQAKLLGSNDKVGRRVVVFGRVPRRNEDAAGDHNWTFSLTGRCRASVKADAFVLGQHWIVSICVALDDEPALLRSPLATDHENYRVRFEMFVPRLAVDRSH
jgi:hypothetical protein